MATYARTYFDIKKEVARLADDLEGSGTADSGSSTTLVHDVLTDDNDSRLRGLHLYIGNGASQASETRVTAFTPGSDRLTFPTITAIDSTSEYMLTRRFSQSDILSAIRMAVSTLGSYSKDYDDFSLIAGSPLVNATFYDNSGTFPNGWTQAGSGGTFTQESGVSKHGRYSAKMVSDGSNACSVYQDVPNIGRYLRTTLQVRCWVYSTTADRVNILIDDGIDTTTGIFTLPTSNDGWGDAVRLTAALPIDNRATRIRVTMNITAGGAVTAYFSAPYIVGGPYAREWEVPSGSPTCIEHIASEDYEGGPLGVKQFRPGGFTAVLESTRRLQLLGDGVPLGRIMHLKGRTAWSDHATAASDDDTSFDGMWSWLTYSAAYHLLLSRPRGDMSQADRLGVMAEKIQPKAARFPSGALDLERN